jgi:hypothetical protein
VSSSKGQLTLRMIQIRLEYFPIFPKFRLLSGLEHIHIHVRVGEPNGSLAVTNQWEGARSAVTYDRRIKDRTTRTARKENLSRPICP